MKNLHILNDDIIPISVDLITQLLTSEEAQKQFFAAIYHQGRVSETANRQSDLELAGTVVSAIVESELVAFLKRENSKRGAKKNYRNGYIPRELHVGKEKLPVQIPRDRNGVFRPSFVHTYSREFRPSIEDILSFAVAEGYRREELAILLYQAYQDQRSDGLIIAKQMPILFESLEKWLTAPAPGTIRLLVGWEKRVRHCAGIEKRICGVKQLEPDGTLSGICAWACDADSDEDIEAKLIHFVKTKCGVNTVQMLFALNHCDAFESAAKKAWPQVKFPAV